MRGTATLENLNESDLLYEYKSHCNPDAGKIYNDSYLSELIGELSIGNSRSPYIALIVLFTTDVTTLVFDNNDILDDLISGILYIDTEINSRDCILISYYINKLEKENVVLAERAKPILEDYGW